MYRWASECGCVVHAPFRDGSTHNCTHNPLGSKSVDVWLRGTEHATTKTIEGLTREPSDWTDADVRLVLEGMLRVMAQLKQPGEEPRTIALRGLSWIVNMYDEGGS